MNTEENVNELDVRLTSHEAVCAERYSNINARMSKIEMLLWTILGVAATSIIGGLVTTVAWLLAKYVLK